MVGPAACVRCRCGSNPLILLSSRIRFRTRRSSFRSSRMRNALHCFTREPAASRCRSYAAHAHGAHTRRHHDHDLQRQAHAHTRVAKQPCVSGGQYYLRTSLLGTVLPRYCPDTALRGCCVSGRPHAGLPCALWQLGVRGRTCVCAPARAHTRTLTHSLTRPHARKRTHARTHAL